MNPKRRNSRSQLGLVPEIADEGGTNEEVSSILGSQNEANAQHNSPNNGKRTRSISFSHGEVSPNSAQNQNKSGGRRRKHSYGGDTHNQYIAPQLAPTKIDDDNYYMGNLNRGVALIFNHVKFSEDMDERVGTKADIDNLTNEILPALGFNTADIHVYEDKELSEINKTLNEFSINDFKDKDCLAIFVLTHGHGQDGIWAFDTDYAVEKIWKPFMGDRCKGLIGKPKLFFIVACKGDGSDRGVTVQQSGNPHRYMTAHDSGSTPTSSYTIPVVADILVVYSTFPGYYSYRDECRGTWYIEALTEEIRGLKQREEIEIIQFLTKVNRRVAISYRSFSERNQLNNKKQCPFITSTFIRTMKFRVKE